jgi:hypothetical protein
MLWLLLVTVPLLALFLGRLAQRRPASSLVVQSRLLANLTVGISRSARDPHRPPGHIRSFITVGPGSAPMGFAWEEATTRSRHPGRHRYFAQHVSRRHSSQSPHSAKLAALDLMRAAKTIGWGSSRLPVPRFAMPLTLDDEAYRQSVEALEVGIIPQAEPP